MKFGNTDRRSARPASMPTAPLLPRDTFRMTSAALPCNFASRTSLAGARDEFAHSARAAPLPPSPLLDIVPHGLARPLHALEVCAAAHAHVRQAGAAAVAGGGSARAERRRTCGSDVAPATYLPQGCSSRSSRSAARACASAAARRSAEGHGGERARGQGGTSMGASDFVPSLRPLPSPLLASPHFGHFAGGPLALYLLSRYVSQQLACAGPRRRRWPLSRVPRPACRAFLPHRMRCTGSGADDGQSHGAVATIKSEGPGGHSAAPGISLGLVAAAQPWVAPSQIIPRFINLTISRIL